MGQYAKQLNALQASVKEQMADYVPGANGFEAVPDGEYNFVVQATIDTAKESGNLMVVFVHTVADGDLEGRVVTDRCTLTAKIGSQICRSRIEMLGYDWPEDNLSALEDILDEIIANAPVVTAKTKTSPQKDNPEYSNTRIRWTDVVSNGDKALPNAEATEETPAEEEAAEETVDESLQGLLDFCAAHDIEGVSAENTVDEIVSALKDAAMVFPAEELTDDEKTFLASVGLEECIQQPKPPVKAKPVVKAAAKPVAKAKPVVKGHK